jgi:hypothetical protein
MLLHSFSWPSSRLAHSHRALESWSGSAVGRSSDSAGCSQTPTVASNDAVASAVPDGDHVSARTVFECPVSIVPAFLKDQDAESEESEAEVFEGSGWEYDHSRTVLSAEQDAMSGREGFQATDHVQPSCPTETLGVSNQRGANSASRESVLTRQFS